jgi:hypothetical protein
MKARRSTANPTSRVAALAVTLGLIITAACGGDGRGAEGLLSPAVNGHGGGDVGSCEEGEVRACLVHLDDANCYEGVQECQSGTWGVCGDYDGFAPASIGMQSDCVNNPCNPWCQHYDEEPSPELTAMGAPPPPGGNVQGLPSAWQKRGLDDNVYGNQPCTEADDCQFDHYCNTMTGACVPWGNGEFDDSANGIDLTVPVVCNDDEITICNRGDMQAPAGIQIAVMDASPTDFQKCSGFNGSLHDTCETAVPIDPGDCLTVTTCDSWNGTKTVYVNPPIPPGTIAPISEATSQSGNACANNWSVYQSGNQCSCSASTIAQTLQPVNMFYVLDNSLSMSWSGIWEPARDATIAFLEDPGSDFLNVTLRTYGDDPTSGCNRFSCDETACADPVAPIDSLGNATHQQALVDFVNNVGFEWGTPHIASLGGATSWATQYSANNPGGQEVVVYVSDGGTLGTCVYNGNNNTRNQVAQKAADALAAEGVLTYTVALPGADTTLLNAIAVSGGTTMFDLTGSMDVDADLTAALQNIQASLLSCNITIPNAGQVDPNNISVDYLSGGVNSNMLTEVADAMACTGAGNEYYLDDPMNPTEITMCPTTCDTVRGDPNAVVEILGGCIGGYAQHEETFTYFADCSGFPGTGPVWQYFYYDADVPGDANIEFEMRTGETAGEAGMGPWTAVSTATNAQPDVYPSAPVNLGDVLGQADALEPYLELHVVLNPTSGGTATPSLLSWDVQFSCLENQ